MSCQDELSRCDSDDLLTTPSLASRRFVADLSIAALGDRFAASICSLHLVYV